MYDYLIHHVPGRLRIKVDAFKRLPHYLQQAQCVLTEVNGVFDVQVKPATGSIIVLYDGERTAPHSLLSVLEAENIISKTRAPFAKLTDSSAQAFRANRKMKTIGKVSGTIGKVVAQTVLEKLLERSVAALF